MKKTILPIAILLAFAILLTVVNYFWIQSNLSHLPPPWDQSAYIYMSLHEYEALSHGNILQFIEIVLKQAGYPIIVKEVGQGMGEGSLRALLQLPLESIEFAAFGGTNFAKVELLRAKETAQQLFEPLSRVGHDAFEMTDLVNEIVKEGNVQCKSIIVSGGIKTFLDGYYLIQKSSLPAIYGQASGFLKYAREDYEQLRSYTEHQIKGLELAYAYLTVKK